MAAGERVSTTYIDCQRGAGSRLIAMRAAIRQPSAFVCVSHCPYPSFPFQLLLNTRHCLIFIKISLQFIADGSNISIIKLIDQYRCTRLLAEHVHFLAN